MKTLITASALTLIANVAFANEIYGNFVSQELDTTVGARQSIVAPPAQSREVAVSLYAFYKGDPDVPQDLRGYVPRMSPVQDHLTAYDMFLIGDPDGGPSFQSHGRPAMDNEQGIASIDRGEGMGS
jgi:hypothetical protein